MSNKTILTCPCCGSSAEVYKQGHREYGPTFTVECRGCGLRTRPYDSKDKAIDHWNLRENGISMQELIEAKQYCGEDSDCAECPFYKEDDCYLNQLQIGDNKGWIPCSERLPEESLNSVIGWDEYRNRCVFVQYYGGRWILGNGDESVKIVAWTNIPQPYKEEGETK